MNDGQDKGRALIKLWNLFSARAVLRVTQAAASPDRKQGTRMSSYCSVFTRNMRKPLLSYICAHTSMRLCAHCWWISVGTFDEHPACHPISAVQLALAVGLFSCSPGSQYSGCEHAGSSVSTLSLHWL